ncbi:DUF1294 domain-containing protein [Salipaludibacillus sp. CF4.18]|uniref:DUF1294 domain-containing protein n=1 Tax=Salipaludibacillus sp. CF4.18 TaxID=3373081 RepID=UPI003EE53D27
MENYFLIAIVYIIIISIVGMTLMLMDKKKAERQQWRISEKNLFIVAILGGAISMHISSKVICHKTSKLKFVIGLPLIFVAQVGLVMYLVL